MRMATLQWKMIQKVVVHLVILSGNGSQTWVWLLWVNISRMRWSIWACEHSVGKLTSAAKRKP